MGMYTGIASTENSMEFPYENKNITFTWYWNPTPGHTFRKKIHNLKRYMHPNILCSTIYNIQAIESIEVFIDRWMDNEDTTYTLNLKKWYKGTYKTERDSQLAKRRGGGIN